MTAPIRIQRSRAKGWRMPANTVYVGRPTRWGNPWTVGLVACGCRSAGECSHNSFRCETAAEAVEAFRSWRETTHAEHRRRDTGFVEKWLAPLRGKNLACWCAPDVPCHADVLLELANKPVCEAA